MKKPQAKMGKKNLLLQVTLNGSDFSLQGLMGRDWRLLAGLVSVLCKNKKKHNEMTFVINGYLQLLLLLGYAQGRICEEFATLAKEGVGNVWQRLITCMSCLNIQQEIVNFF